MTATVWTKNGILVRLGVVSYRDNLLRHLKQMDILISDTESKKGHRDSEQHKVGLQLQESMVLTPGHSYSCDSVTPCSLRHLGPVCSRLCLRGVELVAVVQLPSRVWVFETPRTAAHQASLSLTISWSSSKFVLIELVMLSNHLILCHLLLLLPSIFPSIRVFFNELALHIRWPKYQSFSFSFSPSKEYSWVRAT